MDKPYVVVQCKDYKLTIYNGIVPLNPDNDNVDVCVTFPNGESFSAVFFTLQNIETLMKQYKKTGECAAGMYFWTSDMMIVDKLTEKTICQTIDNLLAEEDFESVFSRNEEPADIFPEEGDELFNCFSESLRKS